MRISDWSSDVCSSDLVRFLESLVSWLRHFEEIDRPAAYTFVKERLVYISTLEMQRVIETFIPETVTPYLRRSVAAELGIKPYEVWRTIESATEIGRASCRERVGKYV